MNSSTIHKILSRDPYTARYFGGVYPSDKIPEVHRTPAAFVINTDKHNEPGTHWIALFIEDKKTLEFFDSYGLSPGVYGNDIARFVMTFSDVKWNKLCLQSLTSNVCGPYCIYYLFKRCQGFCMNYILSQLAGRKNDFRMYQFVKKKYAVNMIFKQ